MISVGRYKRQLAVRVRLKTDRMHLSSVKTPCLSAIYFDGCNFSQSHQHRKWRVNTALAADQPFSSRPECECLVCASRNMVKQTQTNSNSRFRGQTADVNVSLKIQRNIQIWPSLHKLCLEILMNTSSIKLILTCYSRKCYTAYNEQPVDSACFRVKAGIREGLYIWWG